MNCVCLLLFILITCTYFNDGNTYRTSIIRQKRSPFNWDFLQDGVKEIGKAVSKIKVDKAVVEEAKKGWENVKHVIEDASLKVEEHIDNVNAGKYDADASKVWENVRNKVDDVSKTIKEEAVKIGLDDSAKDVINGWETAKGSVDKLSQTGWTPIKEKGQKVVEGFKTSVKHEEKEKPVSTDEKEEEPADICKFPRHPHNGLFSALGIPNAEPGSLFSTLYVTITCHFGYTPSYMSTTACFNGTWLDRLPRCVRHCELREQNILEFNCLLPESDETRPCNRLEPNNTIAIPECRFPNYYSTSELPQMKCRDGHWSYMPTCIPVCGKITPNGDPLVIGGAAVKRGELPWHVGIYRKNVNPYLQICGGSIITTDLVVSAAHCFWTDVDKQLPAALFAVGAGKLYRPWNSPKDVDAQKSDVKEITMPKRFRGAETNFQDDIALVFLTTPFEYKTYVRPICVDFDTHLNNQQLVSGSVGKVAGWGLTSDNGKASPILKSVDLGYVDVLECIMASPPDFREYITSDKFCAGYRNGTALCKGDSGGGMVFAKPEKGFDRYYLRGVVSTAPKNDNACNAYAFTAFTEIVRHAVFIKNYF